MSRIGKRELMCDKGGGRDDKDTGTDFGRALADQTDRAFFFL